MEALLSANEDVLIPPLSLGLKDGASYIQNRRSATIFSSVNQASPQGVQSIKFNISSSQEWCDPQSVIISFDVCNDDAAKALYPSTPGAHCLFDKYSCRIASTEVENIDHYGRTCEMFSRLIPTEKKLNDGALGFGTVMQQYAAAGAVPDGGITAGSANVRRGIEKSLFTSGDHVAKAIPASGKKKVFMKLPLSGIWTANQKYLPLWSMGGGGIEVLLSLCPENSAVISRPTDPLTGVQGAAGSGSTTYHLENIRIEADMIQIDSALQEQYSRNLLEGGSLTLHTKLWNVTQVFLGASNGGNFDVSVSKSLSRCATLFASFSEELTADQQAAGIQYVNQFKAYPAAAESMESHVTVGSKRFPEFQNKGVTAHFWRLISALGVAKSLPHSVSTDVESYGSNSFVLGTDFEACPMVASSGINTTGGQQIDLHCAGFNDGANILRRCWMCLHSEAIVELRATGAHLLT